MDWFPPALCIFHPKVPRWQWYRGGRTRLETKGLRTTSSESSCIGGNGALGPRAEARNWFGTVIALLFLSLFYSLIGINEALFTEDAIRDTIEYVRLAASGVDRSYKRMELP